MALKKSSKPSKFTRNGTASIKLKRRLRRRSMLWKPAIRRMVRKEVTKQVHLILHAMNSSLAGLESTPRSLSNQAEPSVQRRLRLHFVNKLPNKLFTANVVYAIGDGTGVNAPVSVVLLDENNEVVKEGPLSSLKVEIFVAFGNSKAEESETRLVCAREEKGSLLVGSCIKTMENGVCYFSDLKFVDNSSWVRCKMFRLVVKVAENEQVPSTVEIRQGISGSFRVKDQRGKSHDKHPIPSWNDKVRHLEKIGVKYNGMLEKAGICIVKDFLQQYYKDQSFLKRILGVKDGVWETIVQHATKCSPNITEYFRYDSEEGVELLFDCFYKLIDVSFDHLNHRSLETLAEHEKFRVEQARCRALKDISKMVRINSPAGWPSANINHTWISTQDQVVQGVVLNNCPSHPQSPLFLDHDHIQQHDQEVPATQTLNIAGMENNCLFLRSNTFIWDSLILCDENHPLSIPDFTANDTLHGQGSICRPVGSKARRDWCRARVTVAVSKFLNASRSNKTRMVESGF